MIKFIWIITISVCGLQKTTHPSDCAITQEHLHLVQLCKDSLVAIKDKQAMIEFYKVNQKNIKKIDSVQVK